MIYVQYASLVYLSFTTLSVVIGLIAFIYKTKTNKNTIDKKIVYFEMFVPKFERFILSIYLINLCGHISELLLPTLTFRGRSFLGNAHTY